MSMSTFSERAVSALWLSTLLGLFTLPGYAAAQSVVDYRAVPPLLAESATPMVMLAMSNDHQLFYKAYTDFDDLDDDGFADTTYKNSLEYVGYFDSYKCYVYNTTSNLFEPVSVTQDKYCNAAAGTQWSGNFLNWATMTRIDEVRKVLYGGYRSTDTGSETVLERSFLPNDAHSFAKYYNGADLAKLTPFNKVTTGLSNTKDTGITICNTTRQSGEVLSQNSTQPPLARVVAGNYSLWAANERWQCLFSGEQSASNGNSSDSSGIHAYSSNPTTTARPKQGNDVTVGDYVVRVVACKSGLIGQEECKQYPSGNYKPIGILQKFGDNQAVMWGLLTGSYAKNKSGGVLRKNIGFVTDEINTTTNGTFKAAPATGGIINTINKLRLVNYRFAKNNSSGNNDGTYIAADDCEWGKASFLDGKCTNWGNPFSEILLECYRYFAGAGPNKNFDADDSVYLSGLTRQTTWKNPQTAETACASLNVIAFNASTVSYDSDQLDITDLHADKSIQEITKGIGDGEGITGNYFFVGENGSDNNQLCTAKKVDDLGAVEGTCPDAPRLDGSYKSAGLAYHANTTDLRPDIEEKQTVTTYGVTLAPALPNVALTAPNGKRVAILPACRNSSVGGNCGLVDFKVVEQNVAADKTTGKFYVNWEDSEQGGDYDQDMAGVLSYELTNTKLKITTNVYVDSTPFKLGFGFIVAGTTEDGFHSLSGVQGYSGYGCTNCKSTDSAKSKTFDLGTSTVDSSVVKLLEQPLYYAAKWGGFVDIDGDGKPSLTKEWDQRDNTTGANGADGIPDTYFLAINPKQLKEQLTHILVSILERTASGTSAAVVANTGTGEGAIYQALYNPRFGAANGVDAVSWVGTLNALYIDSKGYIREDNAEPKGTLTDADNIIDVFYNPVSQKTQVQRYAVGDEGVQGAPIGAPVDVLDLKPIWSAREQLGNVSDYKTQRTQYSDKANTGRYILTGIDMDGDGQIGMGSGVDEVFDFTGELFDKYFRLLGLKSANAANAANIVNYIRGEDIPGFRNRRIDVDGDGVEEPVLLGDIVHSSPLAVGRPNAAYDLIFGDSTYRKFRQQYQNRRQMVYVGANDGMLHAFNGGFYDASTSSYVLGRDKEIQHPLGSELWAYVPYNLLPHLQWLTKPDYPHVYYVDGAVKSFDVNIFPDDKTHPGGWGTILVVGLRFGGGDYTLDPEFDADGDPSNDITLRSAYVVLDVTDPEQPPTVLAEISHPLMGYTLAEPTLIKARVADKETGSYLTPHVNNWYLVFGSGPVGSTDKAREDALNQAVSDSTAKLFVYDLRSNTLDIEDLNEANSFVGGLQSVDWNRDYVDDAIYFGLVSGAVEGASGKLMRGKVKHNLEKEKDQEEMSLSFGQLLDVNKQPFSATPLTVRDRLGDYWIYAGTGRFYVVEDNFTTDQQSYYGVKDPQSGGELKSVTVKVDDLINTTDIKVFTDGTIDSKSNPGSDIMLNGSDKPAKTFTDVYTAVQRNAGWYFNFSRERSRNITQAVVSDQSLVFTEYQPSGLKCQPEGYGFLNAPHLQAGIPGVFAPLGSDPGSKNGDGAEEVNMSESLGLGSPSSPTIHQRGDGQKVAVVQTSTGELSTNLIGSDISNGQRESWRELLINW